MRQVQTIVAVDMGQGHGTWSLLPVNVPGPREVFEAAAVALSAVDQDVLDHPPAIGRVAYVGIFSVGEEYDETQFSEFPGLPPVEEIGEKMKSAWANSPSVASVQERHAAREQELQELFESQQADDTELVDTTPGVGQDTLDQEALDGWYEADLHEAH